MKQSEIQIGGEYLTRVGDSLVRVRVTHSTTETRGGFGGRRERVGTLYAVQRADGGRRLTPRSAAKLRPAPKRAAKSAPAHTGNGNCDVYTHTCSHCGIGNHCDVCHLHDEPRGICGGCDECPACEASRLESAS